MVSSLYALWNLLLYGESTSVSVADFKTGTNEFIDYVFKWFTNLFGDLGVADLGSFSSSVTLNIPSLILAWVTGLTFLIGLVSLIFRVFQLKRVL